MLTLLVTCGIAYLIWRISEQLPDLVFRLSEIQRDLAEIRRQLERLRENRRPGEGIPGGPRPPQGTERRPVGGGLG